MTSTTSSTVKQYIFGGMSSMVAEFSVFPIDTSKTRLQIQGQTGATALVGRTHYRGMFHTMTTIVREEGFAKLYGGISPALFRQATYGSIRIGLYFQLKQIFAGEGPETFAKNIAAGMVAGSAASAICNPTDVLKVRLQARTASKSLESLSLPRCFVLVFREEGIQGMWRGVLPNSGRAAIIAGVELPVYDLAKSILLSPSFNLSEGKVLHFAASFIAGFAATVASNPVDVLKTRLMNDRRHCSTTGNVHRQYRGALHCAAETLRLEGVWAFYRGFVPNWLRLGPWNIVFFMTLEQLRLADAKLASQD